jgi:hypothetical protein
MCISCVEALEESKSAKTLLPHFTNAATALKATMDPDQIRSKGI